MCNNKSNYSHYVTPTFKKDITIRIYHIYIYIVFIQICINTVRLVAYYIFEMVETVLCLGDPYTHTVFSHCLYTFNIINYYTYFLLRVTLTMRSHDTRVHLSRGSVYT